MNPGDRRESIFNDDRDLKRFLETLGEACNKTGWQAHAYCLMPNHFHLVVETSRSNLGKELSQRGWGEADLKQRRKTDAKKVEIAARLRGETVQTLDWIAQRLQMGGRHTLGNWLKKVRIQQ